HRLVGELHVERVGVDGGVHRHRLDSELAQGADHAQRDLAAVGDEHLLEQLRHYGRIWNSGSPNSTACPFSASTATTTPSTSDSISFMSFIASTMHSTCPFFTRWPGSAKW